MEMQINKLPAYTYGWLKMNSARINDFRAENSIQVKEEIPAGIKTSSALNEKLESLPSGCGKDIDDLLKEKKIERKIFSLDDGKKLSDHIKLDFDYEGKNSLNSYGIVLGQDSELTVIMDLTNKDKKEGFSALQTKILMGKNSTLNLIQVIDLGQDYKIINDIACESEENAHFNVYHLFFSGKEIYQGLKNTMNGEKSNLSVDIGYIVNKDHILDMNYVADQFGKVTNSDIYASGVLRDQAKKIFRASIDFKRGCSGSTGSENEDVLLIDDDVENKTIPLILCAEEDVFGSHGASIGRLDQDLMFYMMNRGLNQEEIYEMMSRAKIQAVIGKIPDQEAKEKLTQLVAQKFGIELE